LAVFSIEHFLIAVSILLKVTLDKEPFWVKIFHARRGFKKNEKKYARVQTMKIGGAILQKKLTELGMGMGNLGGGGGSGLASAFGGLKK
jgi:hypothetical protein